MFSKTKGRACALFVRAVELGITAEDLIMAEEENVVSSPRRLPHAADSDSEVTKAVVGWISPPPLRLQHWLALEPMLLAWDTHSMEITR